VIDELSLHAARLIEDVLDIFYGAWGHLVEMAHRATIPPLGLGPHATVFASALATPVAIDFQGDGAQETVVPIGNEGGAIVGKHGRLPRKYAIENITHYYHRSLKSPHVNEAFVSRRITQNIYRVGPPQVFIISDKSYKWNRYQSRLA